MEEAESAAGGSVSPCGRDRLDFLFCLLPEEEFEAVVEEDDEEEHLLLSFGGLDFAGVGRSLTNPWSSLGR